MEPKKEISCAECLDHRLVKETGEKNSKDIVTLFTALKSKVGTTLFYWMVTALIGFMGGLAGLHLASVRATGELQLSLLTTMASIDKRTALIEQSVKENLHVRLSIIENQMRELQKKMETLEGMKR